MTHTNTSTIAQAHTNNKKIDCQAYTLDRGGLSNLEQIGSKRYETHSDRREWNLPPEKAIPPTRSNFIFTKYIFNCGKTDPDKHKNLIFC